MSDNHYICTMIKRRNLILQVLAGILLGIVTSCSGKREEAIPYNWTIIDSDFDNCAKHLEQSYIVGCNDSILELLTDSLEILASTARVVTEAKNQLKARSHYWRARLAEYKKIDDSKQQNLELAFAMSDSSRYPYDNIKFRVAYCYPPRNNERYAKAYETLYDALEYFKKHREYISVGRVGVHMSNLLREARLYNEAETLMNQSVEIYRRLGLNEFVVKSQLNYANILSETDRDSAINLLTELLNNPVSKTDFLFYNTLLRNYYILTGEAPYIFEAYRQIQNMDKYTDEKGLYLTKIADYYLNAPIQQIDSAKAYIERALELVDSMDMDDYKISVYHTAHAIYELNGDQSSAYKFLKLYAGLIEKKQKRLFEMAQVDKKGTIQSINKNIEVQEKSENIRLISIFCSVIILIVILAVIVYRRIKTHKNARISAESERNRRGLQVEGLAIDLEEKEHMLSHIEKKMMEMHEANMISPTTVHEVMSLLKLHAMRKNGREKFQEIHESLNPNFYKRLRNDYPSLTENDIRFASYLAIGLTNSEISNVMMIQYQSVKNYRYRLKQKMSLSKDDVLNEVIRQYAEFSE